MSFQAGPGLRLKCRRRPCYQMVHMGLVLPMPGDMDAGRLVNDDDALAPDEEG